MNKRQRKKASKKAWQATCLRHLKWHFEEFRPFFEAYEASIKYGEGKVMINHPPIHGKSFHFIPDQVQNTKKS